MCGILGRMEGGKERGGNHLKLKKLGPTSLLEKLLEEICLQKCDFKKLFFKGVTILTFNKKVSTLKLEC